MRAIYIDADQKLITAIEIEGTLEEFYKLLDCSLIEVVPIGGKNVLVIDEEGKLRNLKNGFIFNHKVYVGSGIILAQGRDNFVGTEHSIGATAFLTSFLDF